MERQRHIGLVNEYKRKEDNTIMFSKRKKSSPIPDKMLRLSAKKIYFTKK
jgi:hypothetical protein